MFLPPPRAESTQLLLALCGGWPGFEVGKIFQYIRGIYIQYHSSSEWSSGVCLVPSLKVSLHLYFFLFPFFFTSRGVITLLLCDAMDMIAGRPFRARLCVCVCVCVCRMRLLLITQQRARWGVYVIVCVFSVCPQLSAPRIRNSEAEDTRPEV